MRKPLIATLPRRPQQPISPEAAQRQKAFHLRPRSPLVPDGDQLVRAPRSSFWTWVVVVALLHCALLAGLLFFMGNNDTKAATPQFISLLPAGDLVQGSPGASQALKQSVELPMAATPDATPPDSAPLEPNSEAIKPPRRVRESAVEPALAEDPLLPPEAHHSPETRPKPAKPKIKVSLNEVTRLSATGSTSTEALSKAKIVHPAKPAPHSAVAPELKNSGLSREQVARELGKKLAAEGVDSAEKSGPSGAPTGQANSFASFYASVRDQVMNNWEHPEVADSRASPPIVRIHIDSQNHVPPEQVSLVQSSGNPAYDESALAAARRLGYLQEPLPAGCSPDITIKFTLTP